MDSNKVCILGLGYIGLPTAALLATKGYHVVGVDVKPDVVDKINQGQIHIVEPALDVFVKSALQSGNLVASLIPDYADVFIIAVPTYIDEHNNPDISSVFDAAKAIVPYVKEGNFIILESTSPVGTTEKLVDLFSAQGVDTTLIHFAYSPERVMAGQTMHELVENDRIVGGITKEAAIHVALFYESFIQGEVVVTNARTAEMAKLAENASRDINLAFANELSLLCDKYDINVWELINLANRHPRTLILNPGSGVGGHCISVDPWFIVADNKNEARLIKEAREINNQKPVWICNKIMTLVKEFKETHNRMPEIACMGITYKPDIDDLSGSPALMIAQKLISAGLNIIISEPNIKTHNSIQLTSAENAVMQADIIVFLIAHKEFKALDVPKGKIVLDFCGVKSKYKSRVKNSSL